MKVFARGLLVCGDCGHKIGKKAGFLSCTNEDCKNSKKLFEYPDIELKKVHKDTKKKKRITAPEINEEQEKLPGI